MSASAIETAITGFIESTGSDFLMREWEEMGMFGRATFIALALDFFGDPRIFSAIEQKDFMMLRKIACQVGGSRFVDMAEGLFYNENRGSAPLSDEPAIWDALMVLAKVVTK